MLRTMRRYAAFPIAWALVNSTGLYTTAYHRRRRIELAAARAPKFLTAGVRGPQHKYIEASFKNLRRFGRKFLSLNVIPRPQRLLVYTVPLQLYHYHGQCMFIGQNKTVTIFSTVTIKY